MADNCNVVDGQNVEQDECPREQLPELAAADHLTQFDPSAYLTSFYKSPHEDEAMKIPLFFLPGIIYRVPIGGSMLDLGAGNQRSKLLIKLCTKLLSIF